VSSSPLKKSGKRDEARVIFKPAFSEKFALPHSVMGMLCCFPVQRKRSRRAGDTRLPDCVARVLGTPRQGKGAFPWVSSGLEGVGGN